MGLSPKREGQTHSAPDADERARLPEDGGDPRYIYLDPMDVKGIEDLRGDKPNCMLFVYPGGFYPALTEKIAVRHSSVEVIEALCSHLPGAPSFGPRELTKEEKEAAKLEEEEKIERLGAAMARGQKRGMDEADRNDWGKGGG